MAQPSSQERQPSSLGQKIASWREYDRHITAELRRNPLKAMRENRGYSLVTAELWLLPLVLAAGCSAAWWWLDQNQPQPEESANPERGRVVPLDPTAIAGIESGADDWRLGIHGAENTPFRHLALIASDFDPQGRWWQMEIYSVGAVGENWTIGQVDFARKEDNQVTKDGPTQFVIFGPAGGIYQLNPYRIEESEEVLFSPIAAGPGGPTRVGSYEFQEGILRISLSESAEAVTVSEQSAIAKAIENILNRDPGLLFAAAAGDTPTAPRLEVSRTPTGELVLTMTTKPEEPEQTETSIPSTETKPAPPPTPTRTLRPTSLPTRETLPPKAISVTGEPTLPPPTLRPTDIILPSPTAPPAPTSPPTPDTGGHFGLPEEAWPYIALNPNTGRWMVQTCTTAPDGQKYNGYTFVEYAKESPTQDSSGVWHDTSFRNDAGISYRDYGLCQ